MPLTFGVPAQQFVPQVVDPTDLAGEDISLRGGDLSETSSGDWAVLSGPPATRQSVEREAGASPGDMPRRPDWGMGLRDSLMRGTGRDLRDKQQAAVRRRLNANPRIDRIDEVTVVERTDLDTKGVVTITIAAISKGQRVNFTTSVLPRRGL